MLVFFQIDAKFMSSIKDHHLVSGNEYLSRILAQGQYELKVELEDFDGNTRYARYTTFDVGNRTSNFKLTVGGYSGDAGT